MNPIHSEPALLSKIARLYYEDGLSILEIASMHNISRQTCSKHLKKARAIGIVKIQISHPDLENLQKKEEAIRTIFSLKEVFLSEVFIDHNEHLIKSVAQLGVTVLMKKLKKGTKIGVALGRTLYELTNYIPQLEQEGDQITIVEVIGGLSRISTDHMATEIPRRMAQKLNSKVIFLTAPAFTKDQETRDAMLQDDSIRATLAEPIDLALLGIGNASSQTMLIKMGITTNREHHELQEKGAVGVINGTFFDLEGRIVDFTGNRRRIAIPLEDFKRVPEVIGIAGGSDKEKAIIGALRGGYVNILITDTFTAQGVLDLVGFPESSGS